MVWFRVRVARQRSAKPFTAVRIRSKPPFLADKMQFDAFCPLFLLGSRELPKVGVLTRVHLFRSQALHRIGHRRADSLKADGGKRQASGEAMTIEIRIKRTKSLASKETIAAMPEPNTLRIPISRVLFSAM